MNDAMNANLRMDGTDLELARSIAALEDSPPPGELLTGVMARIEPKQPSLWRRLHRWLAKPFTVTMRPWQLAPAGALAAAAALVFALSPGGVPTAHDPLTAQADPAAQQAAYERIPIQFTLDAATAAQLNGDLESVALVGNFNNWSPAGYDMTLNESTGEWTLTVRMAPGRHPYGFLVNGEKLLPDPRAVLYDDDGFGNINSILLLDVGMEGGNHGTAI